MILSIPAKVRGDCNLGSFKSRMYRKLGFVPCSVSTINNGFLNVIISLSKVSFLLRRGVRLADEKYLLVFKGGSPKGLKCVLTSLYEDPLSGRAHHLDFSEEVDE